MAYKHRVLTLEERVKVVEMYENKQSFRSISAIFGCGRTQVRNIYCNRERILAQWKAEQNGSNFMRNRSCVYEDINQMLWKWYLEKTSENVTVTCKMLQKQGMAFGKLLERNTFTASNGWLQSWRRRYLPKRAQTDVNAKIFKNSQGLSVDDMDIMKVSESGDANPMRIEHMDELDDQITSPNHALIKVKHEMLDDDVHSFNNLDGMEATGSTYKEDIDELDNTPQSMAAPDGRNYVRKRNCVYEDINQMLWKWYLEKTSENITVTSKMLQDQGMAFSKILQKDSFTASSGWLRSWKRYYLPECAQAKINTKTLNDDSFNVNDLNEIKASEASDHISIKIEVMDDDMLPCEMENKIKELSDVTNGYQLADIFNADQTNLEIYSFPESVIENGGEDNESDISEERLTVLLACSACGEKLEPLVIGKSTDAEWLQNHSSIIPVSYKCNENAWMSNDIFQQWLNELNNKMVLSQRRILLILGDCPASVSQQLSNVEVCFLSADVDTRLQPLDAGIIQAFKMQYQKSLIQRVISNFTNSASLHDTIKKITILDIVLLLNSSWNHVSSETVKRCFSLCGIGSEYDLSTLEVEEVCDAKLLQGIISNNIDVSKGSISSCAANDSSCDSALSTKNALDYAVKLKEFAVFQEKSELLTQAEKLLNMVQEVHIANLAERCKD